MAALDAARVLCVHFISHFCFCFSFFRFFLLFFRLFGMYNMMWELSMIPCTSRRQLYYIRRYGLLCIDGELSETVWYSMRCVGHASCIEHGVHGTLAGPRTRRICAFSLIRTTIFADFLFVSFNIDVKCAEKSVSWRCEVHSPLPSFTRCSAHTTETTTKR